MDGEDNENTSTVSSAWFGDWTRCMNHHDTDHNVDFKSATIGGKIRIIAVSKRKIMFGEEVTTYYGPDYFAKEKPKPKHKKKVKRRETLDIRGQNARRNGR